MLDHSVDLPLLFSGYTGVFANGDGDKGVAECPFEFYHLWVTNPLAAQKMAERVTRPTIGVKCCPVVSPEFMIILDRLPLFLSHIPCVIKAGIPPPDEQYEEKDIQELTHELDLT